MVNQTLFRNADGETFHHCDEQEKKFAFYGIF